MNVGKIMNFGGKIKPVNCGPENEYAALYQAYYDMKGAAIDETGFFEEVSDDLKYRLGFADNESTTQIDKSNDLYLALQTNVQNMLKFKATDEYQKWIAGKNELEVTF